MGPAVKVGWDGDDRIRATYNSLLSGGAVVESGEVLVVAVFFVVG